MKISKNKVVAVFDIGKTNKKILLFDEKLNIVYFRKEKFETVVDEDGFECDNIELLEAWVINTLKSLLKNCKYEITAVNFSTYGASLVFQNKETIYY